MQVILDYLNKTYAPHAVILYGSYADGTQGEGSDFDAVVITDFPCPEHDRSVVGGVQLDVWPVGSEDIAGCDPADYTHLIDAKILLDRHGVAEELLRRVAAWDAAQPWPEHADIEQNLAWCDKMLRRTERGDAEGLYRLHWLLTDSLSIWCDAAHQRYRGPKKTLRTLMREDPAGYLLYREALASASLAEAAAWVDHLHRMFDGKQSVTFRVAFKEDMGCIWQFNVDMHPGDARWAAWRERSLARHGSGDGVTFVCVVDGMPVGEVTLVISPAHEAIRGRTALADGKQTGNVNALRIAKAYEGRGYASEMFRLLTAYAKEHGMTRLTIGVEACEARNRAIYAHWGFDRFLMRETEDGEEVLYYAKDI